MQPIVLNVILGRVATKSDGSLSLNFSTSEMDAMETTVLIKLCRINLKMQLTPVGEPIEAPVEVKSELNPKTAGQRLRAVLFVLFRQWTESGKIKGVMFEQFYSEQMERFIQDIKGQLEPEQV